MNTPAQATPSNFALFAQRYPQLERVSIVARGISSKGVRKIRRRWWAVRARLHTRESVAYHEAGHVVVACRNVTNALLDDPRVWAGAERLAKALYRRRYLSPCAVKQVLGDAFFAGVKTDAGQVA
jgi:hypothetical protein